MTADKVQILDDLSVFEGFNRLRRMHLRYRRYDGSWSNPIEREILERCNGAALLPYDPVRDEVVLLRQFRAGAYLGGHEAWQWELIGGLLDTDESIEATLRREAAEEAGCAIGQLQPIGVLMPMPGLSTESYHLYCGRIDSSGVGGIHGCDAEDENILVETMAYSEAAALLARGGFQYMLTAYCLYWLAANRHRLRQLWAQEPRGLPV